MPDSELPPPGTPHHRQGTSISQFFFGSCAFLWSLNRGAGVERDKREAEGGREGPHSLHLGFGPRRAPTRLGWERGKECRVSPTHCGMHCLGEKGAPNLPCLLMSATSSWPLSRALAPGKARLGSHWCRQRPRRSQPRCPRAAAPGHRRARRQAGGEAEVWTSGPQGPRAQALQPL